MLIRLWSDKTALSHISLYHVDQINLAICPVYSWQKKLHSLSVDSKLSILQRLNPFLLVCILSSDLSVSEAHLSSFPSMTQSKLLLKMMVPWASLTDWFIEWILCYQRTRGDFFSFCTGWLSPFISTNCRVRQSNTDTKSSIKVYVYMRFLHF